jgi:hypothetical protein
MIAKPSCLTPPNKRAQAADSMIPDGFAEEQALMLVAYIAVGAPRQWSADACRCALREYLNDDAFNVPIDRIPCILIEFGIDR